MKTRWPIERKSVSKQRKISFHKIDHENQVSYPAKQSFETKEISFHKMDHHENQVAYSAKQCSERNRGRFSFHKMRQPMKTRWPIQ